MYSNITTSEYSLQLKEAKRIIKAEQSRKREVFLQKAKQIVLGILCIAISIASPLLLDGDGTISVIMLPVGIYITFTRQNIFSEEEFK